MGRRREVTLALVLASSIAIGLVPAAAPADDPATEARAHYDKGIQLYEDGAFDAALVEFERAYELNPSWRILYNIGLIHQQLNDYAAALKTYQRYLGQGGNEVPPERRAEVEKSIETMRARVATLTITVDLAGADVAIDDRAIGRSPLSEAVIVNSGHHRVTATKDGRTAVKLVTVAALDTATIQLVIGAPPVEVPKAATPEVRVPWIAWGVTAALTGGAVISGALAIRASTRLSDDRRADGVTRDTLDADHSKTKTLALVTDVLLGGALVMGGVSLYLTLAPPRESSTAIQPEAPTIRVGLGPGSVQLLGEF
jgi:hypothetical protein